jgi:hypothetical protein
MGQTVISNESISRKKHTRISNFFMLVYFEMLMAYFQNNRFRKSLIQNYSLPPPPQKKKKNVHMMQIVPQIPTHKAKWLFLRHFRRVCHFFQLAISLWKDTNSLTSKNEIGWKVNFCLERQMRLLIKDWELHSVITISVIMNSVITNSVITNWFFSQIGHFRTQN